MGGDHRLRHAVRWAIVFGIAARLAFALGYWQAKPLTHDEQEYLSLGLNLAAGRGFTPELPSTPPNPAGDRFSRAPLYPALLAVVLRATGADTDRLPSSVPHVVQVFQSALGGLTIWLGALLAARISGTTAAAIAAWLVAAYPPLVWSCAYALSEAVYTPMALTAAFALGQVVDWRIPVRQPGDLGGVLQAGLLTGVAALVRPAAIVFGALSVVWLLGQRRWALAVVAGTALAAVVLPWTIRNAVVHDRFIAIAAEGGVTFWTGNHPLAIGEGDLAANPEIKRDHVAFRATLEGLTPEQAEPHYYRAAFAYIREHPRDVATLWAKKFFYTWVPIGPSYRLHSRLYYGTTLASYLPVLLLALGGLPLVFRAVRPPWALALLAVSSVAVGLIFFPQERFRLAVMDPTLCVFAAVRLSGRRHD